MGQLSRSKLARDLSMDLSSCGGDVKLLICSFGHVDWRSYQHLVMQQRQEFLQLMVELITTALKPAKKSRTHWEALLALARVTGIN